MSIGRTYVKVSTELGEGHMQVKKTLGVNKSFRKMKGPQSEILNTRAQRGR